MGRYRYYLGILILLHGCVSVPQSDLATYRESVGCDRIAETSLAAGDWSRGDWPDREWWKGFGDAALNELIEKALGASPTLAKAENSLKAAYQVALQKKAKLFPEVNFDADSDWQHISRYGLLRGFIPKVFPAVVNEIKLGLNFTYEFDFWGKNRDLFRAALSQADAFWAEHLQAELILTTSIAYTYAELQLLLKEKTLWQEMVSNLKEIERIRLHRQEQALDNALTHLQASSDTLNAEASLVEIEEKIAAHMHKLKALAGLDQDAELQFTFRPLKSLVVALPENLSLDLIARRPDLIAQKARLESAAKQISAAKTDFYPNVNLGAFLGLDSFFPNHLFSLKSFSGVLDPAIHLPIFTAGRLRAQLDEKVADYNDAVQSYDTLILQAAQEVADSLTSLYRYHKEISVREQSLQVVQKQSDLTERRLHHAIDDRITFLNSKNAVLEMELTFAEVAYGKQLASINLIRALGGGFGE
jgi:NodT family efflux transporter outer membrane factor (OMF) lipoprotein